MSVIIYGPQGCGKSMHKELIRNHYGLTNVLDDYSLNQELPDDTLALTNDPGIPNAVDYFAIMEEIADEQTAASTTPNVDDAFESWTSTWNVADMSIRDIFEAGFHAGTGGHDE